MYLEDKKVRLAAFAWLAAQERIYGEELPRKILEVGFELEGHRIPLVSAQGIFKPKVLAEIPLSITTAPSSQYDDRMDAEGQLVYKYRGTDPMHRDNVGLRKAWQHRIPLVYFYGLMPGKYMAVWPVFIDQDYRSELSFSVRVDDRSYVDFYAHQGEMETLVAEPADEGRRIYVTSEVKRRLHQRSFRMRVLNAYNEQCTMCRLRHSELLDAAHIIPDGEPGGEPVISNGLALCKLHHAAYDNFFIGIRPDHVIEIKDNLLREDDGPMLLHGLQGLHGSNIILPRSFHARPSPERLKSHYDQFLSSGIGGAA
jgi:putative restriction endonuclease